MNPSSQVFYSENHCCSSSLSEKGTHSAWVLSLQHTSSGFPGDGIGTFELGSCHSWPACLSTDWIGSRGTGISLLFCCESIRYVLKSGVLCCHFVCSYKCYLLVLSHCFILLLRTVIMLDMKASWSRETHWVSGDFCNCSTLFSPTGGTFYKGP